MNVFQTMREMMLVSFNRNVYMRGMMNGLKMENRFECRHCQKHQCRHLPQC